MASELKSRQVIEDHFWTNEADMRVETIHCFDIVSVTPGQTIEFIANNSTPPSTDIFNGMTGAWIELEHVTEQGVYIDSAAFSLHLGANPGVTEVNQQSTLVYRQKVTEDTHYKLCFSDALEPEPNVAAAGSYQYGYRIYGEGYNLQQHTFTN